MPSIDLARLRKQALRLADFFFAPDEFARHLNATLDSYVNYTARSRRSATSANQLPTHRTPAVVLRQIEQGLTPLAGAAENATAALALADRLWDDEWMESRLLAAFILGRVPPDEAPLIARLTAWIAQVRDPELRAQVLETSLHRMRRESPDMFLQLMGEWLRPERARLWPAAIEASIAAARDAEFPNLPGLIASVEMVLRASPPEMQLEFEALIVALYTASPTETTYLLRQILSAEAESASALMFRRLLPGLPGELQDEIRDLLRGRMPSVR